MRVGYLGPTGTHSHVAAKQFKQMLRQHNTADSVALFPMATFTQLLHDVEAQAIELACVPIENALEGSVNEVIDNLALYRDELAIVGDFVIPIRHALIRTVSARDGIQFIHSHPHVWNQCRQTIYDLLGHDVTYISTSSSAEAIRALNAQDASHAALGTLEAAEHHGLDIVMEDCSAHNKNATRFLLIAHKDTNPLADWAIDTLPRKTSYCFAFREDEAGILIKGLKVLADANLNMTKIESRPTKQALGAYMFLVDVEGDVPQAVEAEFKTHCSFLKILGRYPVFGLIEAPTPSTTQPAHH